MKKPILNRQELIDKLVSKLNIIKKYGYVIFVVFVISLYGFLLLSVNSLSNAQPLAEDVTNQINAAAIPHIDQSVVKQLQSLQDNSVNVQSLFDQARSNPFQ